MERGKREIHKLNRNITYLQEAKEIPPPKKKKEKRKKRGVNCNKSEVEFGVLQVEYGGCQWISDLGILTEG